MGEWDPGLKVKGLEWMEKHIAGTSFTDNAPIIPIASLHRVLSKYLPHFFSQWFSSFISTVMFTPSLSLSLAGYSFKRTWKGTGGHSVFKHNWHSHLSGAEGIWERCSPCSSGQLVDCGTLIITLSKPEHRPLHETSDITYGWNEVRRGQKRWEMSWPWQLSKLPLRCNSQHQSWGCIFSWRRGSVHQIRCCCGVSTLGQVSQAKQPSWRRM